MVLFCLVLENLDTHTHTHSPVVAASSFNSRPSWSLDLDLLYLLLEKSFTLKCRLLTLCMAYLLGKEQPLTISKSEIEERNASKEIADCLQGQERSIWGLQPLQTCLKPHYLIGDLIYV